MTRLSALKHAWLAWLSVLPFAGVTVGFAVGPLQQGLPGEMPTKAKFKNSLGMELVRIEPGRFIMGNDKELPPTTLDAKEFGSKGGKVWLPAKGDYDETPTHEVSISKAFYLGTCEVTNAQYEQFDPRHAKLRGKLGFSVDPNEAVVFVTWEEAKAFCDWLSKKEGLPYRWPTEAEWEYACRAGTTTPYWTGNTLPKEFIKNPDNSWFPVPGRGRGKAEVVPLHVGQTKPNPWGLYDMHGNVEEWCHDWYGPYETGNQVDPVGREDGDFRVTRGGSHATFPFYLRSANRMGTLPDDKSWLIGFRVVLGEMPKTKPLAKVAPAAHQRNVKQGVPADITKGPDPGQPFFRGPRPYVKIPENSEGPLFSRHNHDPGITECPNGDLLAIWYTTVTERGREIAVAASRLRHGQDAWDPASPFWDAPDRNDHCPAPWYDGDKTIYHFNALSSAATWGPLAILMRSSTDNGVTWSRARLIVPEHAGRHQVVESIFRTKEGFWVIPCDASPGGSGGTALQISRDAGKTWSDPGGTIAGIHAGVAQLGDGRLLAFGRGDTIKSKMPMSVSADMGKTWTKSASVFPPIGGGQRLVLTRLKEGPLLLASFANKADKGIKITDAAGKTRTVEGLFTALSYDDGKTWSKFRLVTDGGPNRELTSTDGRSKFILGASSAETRGYMAARQARNGVVHLITSANHYAFNLKWLESPTPALP